MDVLDALSRHGWKWQPGFAHDDRMQPLTLKRFLTEVAGDDDWYISTANHAMAYRNGVLVDTAFGTGRRKVTAAVKIWK